MKILKAISFISIAVFMASCATPAPQGPPKRYCSDGREVPRWAFIGGAAFPGDRGKVFYGKGEAGGISDSSLRNEAAQNRAINDLAKSFKVAVKSLMDDYRASTSAGDKEAAERHTEAVQRTVVDQTLSGVTLHDLCEDTSNGTTYALVKLDSEAFTSAIEKNKELGEKMKEYVRANAEKSFQKLEGATGGAQ
ncbi:MAG: LPP20 family lipoprotein [Nitrospinae bacterium]|nr:LPP20 family lipoprotein [Nitrospinota bacterium]